ncbi:MAG: DUF2203 domain-containing protein [Chthonomonadales bacterium]
MIPCLLPEVRTMPSFRKYFTLEEARAWLPQLRARFQRIHSLYAELHELRAAFEAAQRIIRGNGSSPKKTGFEARAQELTAILQEIMAAGIEVKDIGRGLVDFPHLMDGREVFLCWELSEDDIRYWHPIDAGYAGRVPLDG